jgi:asparagine N-glycosylation enzyme membrane subunit Stt3
MKSNSNRLSTLLFAAALIYIGIKFSMSNYSQERYSAKWKDPEYPIYHVTSPNSNSIYSTNFQSKLPQKNMKFRPENELGNISSDHLVYDT